MAAAEGEATQKKPTMHRGPKVANPSPSFISYYKQYVPAESWDLFMDTMKRPLPTTFRLSASDPRVSTVLACMEEKHVAAMDGIEIDGKPIRPCRPIMWYPNRLGWQFDFPKVALRKQPTLKLFHEFLKAETTAGILSRQEAVSMVPVLMLGAAPHHHILDACAAPGMKTLQLLDQLHHECSFPTGFVIANDADGRRCTMLAHISKRMRSPAILISHHDATTLPRPGGEDGGFDRILCDVPCSSDGTMRKAPHLWFKWKPTTGLGMHCLQLRIATHCVSLLKTGGRMCYSTCSLNPMENEAVVAELIRSSNGTLRLMETAALLPELERAAGLTTWKVVPKADGVVTASLTEALANGQSQVVRSMFAPTEHEVESMHLDRCVRIWPHLGDTGGFFVSLLEKIEQEPSRKRKQSEAAEEPAPAEAAELSAEVLKELPKDEVVAVSELPHNLSDEPFRPIDSALAANVKNFFGLSEGLPMDQLLTRSSESNKLLLVSTGIKDLLLNCAAGDEFKAISGGCRVLERSNFNKSKRECEFRLVQEGLHLIGPFLTKRVIHLDSAEEFCLIACHKAVEIKSMQNEATRTTLEAMETGSMAISCMGTNGQTVWAAGEKTEKTLQLFVTKEERAQLVSMVQPNSEFTFSAGTVKQLGSADMHVDFGSGDKADGAGAEAEK